MKHKRLVAYLMAVIALVILFLVDVLATLTVVR